LKNKRPRVSAAFRYISNWISRLSQEIL